uniref:Uncharacterized protein n=1 Tax=Rhizobium phage IG49 TaxID=3129228 RepID=A0AAU8HYX7_9CAUD
MNSDALGSTFWVGKQGAPFWYEMASEGFLPEETRVFGSRVPNFPYTGKTAFYKKCTQFTSDPLQGQD